ncbi:hypothetical protein SHKM778_79420 [Streptomyces sp. KM77-8]|uniref:Uncharacterized protein n=1 Tax=Streptomyces haneummycinicus TaxID=3074435 RepID=A0AAT9HW00_9ACTN
MSRTFSTSRTQREVIQAQGHSGSNQKSTGVAGVVSDMSLLKREVCLREQPGRSSPFPAAPRQGRMAGSILFLPADDA